MAGQPQEAATAAAAAAAAPVASSPLKPIHSLVLDTGPLIKNDPSSSALLSKAEQLYILPSVIPEIRDAATRSRVQTTLLPFVTVRAPQPASVKFVAGFARKTGDLSVLSRPDLEVLALGYELECERNGGDWRLRNTPGQKRLNGRPTKEGDSAEAAEDVSGTEDPAAQDDAPALEGVEDSSEPGEALEEDLEQLKIDSESNKDGATADATNHRAVDSNEDQTETIEAHTLVDGEKADEVDNDDEDDDEDGWITPSNLKKHQAKDAGSSANPSQPAAQKTLQAAILTSDYAMQNVALRMNLNLVAPSFARITHIKSWVLRCHGCFHVTHDTSKQFCPSCGQPTLNRTSCSTDDRGVFRVHLKRNFQWNNRGNVYSVPKPVHGSSNGRRPVGGAGSGGGKGGWGKDLILAEDQKEYTRAADEQRRARKKDLMDDDYLPDLLSGRRPGQTGKLKVGAGRNVNSRRKR